MYVDALHDRSKDVIKVVERDTDGSRQYVNYPARYIFYYPDSKGDYTDIHGNRVSRFLTTSKKVFEKEKKLKRGKGRLNESDSNVVFRCLADNYLESNPPALNKIFFDIEVDFNKEYGFADPSDPFNRVTAIALHLSWMDKTVCLVNKPDSMEWSKAEEIVARFDNVVLLKNEKELLLLFLDLIEDGDILSGWNSEGFDIPYMVNRVARVLGKDYTRKFCLWGEYPKNREFEKFGSMSQTFDLVGRVHLDYLELYRKYTYHEMHSYALDAIAEYELEERKVEYEGTLDQLYHDDFEKFIKYNIQDTNILVRLDKKLQYIEQTNLIAHANTVLLPTTMGAVAQIDQAIINEAHRLGLQVPDKRRDITNTDAAGAYVANPKKGLHRWIGSMDLNSLYPSILRALNMSPETIVGQLRQTYTNEHIAKFDKLVDAWEGLFACFEYDLVMTRDRDKLIKLDFENGETIEATGAEIYELIYHGGMPWCLTSNGTILNAEKTGVIPSLLDRWYTERKQLQKKEKMFGKLADGEVKLPNAFADLNSNAENKKPLNLLEWNDFENAVNNEDQNLFQSILDEYPVHVSEGILRPDVKDDCADARDFWDKRQLVRKILLNSAYGALLNAGSKFFDQRLGQSTTLTGRSIAKHMAAQINKEITGVYDHTGDAVIYGDTDSVYFSAWPVLKDQVEAGKIDWSKEIVRDLYGELTERANQTFPDYMKEYHHVEKDRGQLIAAKREILGSLGLFIKKKRYAIMVYDDEGSRKDVDGKPGKVKAMGLDLKRSDTPKFMQDFLKSVLEMVLTDTPEDEVLEIIRDFRKEFKKMPAWEQGSPKRVNRLTFYYYNEYDVDKDGNERFKGKSNMPGHVRAAINYNRLRKMNNDQYSIPVSDSMKTVVCRLKDNPLKFSSIAIPIDEKRIPEWFKELPFDSDTMEEIIIDKKIDNLLGVLNWDLKSTEDSEVFRNLFSF